MKNRRIKNVSYEFKNNKQAVFALTFIIAMIVLSITAPFWGIDPDAINVKNKLQMPGNGHFFGTDEMGRDYFIRVLYGGRISLLVGVLAMFTAVFVGTIIGMLSGYFGGVTDMILMRIVDILSAIPWIILVTVIGLLFKRGLASIIIVIGLFSWMGIARLVRAEVMSAKEMEYVRYAEFIGTPSRKVMKDHILPTILPTIITASTSALAGAIMTESALSFLGLGVAAPMSSWGSLLQSAQQYLQKAPHMAIIPGILIILTVYSFNKLGDVIRVFAEPRVLAGEKNDK